MKRDKAAARPPTSARPRRRSTSQSAGRSVRAARSSRLDVTERMGVSELFSSWPRTRISRCQACRSSSRRARLTSERTRRSSGRPPCRTVPWRASNRPETPGNGRSTTRGPVPPSRRTSARPSSSALKPIMRSDGIPSRRSPARLVRRSFRSASKASTATSISASTLRRRAVASRASSRSSRSTAASAFSSTKARFIGSWLPSVRARNEKSPSRSAPVRLPRVCSGRTIASCSAASVPSPITTTPATSVTRRPADRGRAKARASAAAAAGTSAPTARSRTRRVWVRRRRRLAFIRGGARAGAPLEAEALQAAVQGAAREAQGLRRAAHVAVVARQRLLDEQALDLLQAHVVQAGGGAPLRAQGEVGGADALAPGHEQRALHRVVQLADVARPGVAGHGLEGPLVEAANALAVAPRVRGKEVAGQGRYVLGPLAQRRYGDLDGVEAEEQVLAEPPRGHLGAQ